MVKASVLNDETTVALNSAREFCANDPIEKRENDKHAKIFNANNCIETRVLKDDLLSFLMIVQLSKNVRPLDNSQQ